MAQRIEEKAGVITIRQQYSVVFRLFLTAISFIPLLVPYELLYQPRWNLADMSWQGLPLFLFFLFLAFIPLAMTAGLWVAVLFGVDEVFSFDLYKQRFSYHAARRLWRPAQHLEIAYEDLPELSLERHHNSEGPDEFALSLQLANRKKMNIAHFSDEQTARALMARLLVKNA